MAKVLISTLGVGPVEEEVPKREYKDALYKFSRNNSQYKTHFLSAALVQELNVDKVLFIGTYRSMWENVYHYFMEKSQIEMDVDYWIDLGEKVAVSDYQNKVLVESDLDGVNKAIDSFLKTLREDAEGGSNCLIIDYGLTEDELWKNFHVFMRISKMLQNGDEIHLDITHSFRSIPLYMYLMMNLIQNLNHKKIKLAGIYYGMLDVKGELGYAPVIDLKQFFQISDWIRGVYDFIRYGNGYLIADLIDDKEISACLRNISDLVNLNYLIELKSEIDKLNYQLNTKDISKFRVLQYLLPHIKIFIDRFTGINTYSKFQYELSKWYYENKRFANGYICLAESIITKLTEVYQDTGEKIDIRKSSDRKVINDKIKKKLIRKEFKSAKEYIDIYNLYDSISRIRNQIAHAGLEKGNTGITYQDALNKYTKFANRVNDLLFVKNNLKDIPRNYPFSKL